MRFVYSKGLFTYVAVCFPARSAKEEQKSLNIESCKRKKGTKTAESGCFRFFFFFLLPPPPSLPSLRDSMPPIRDGQLLHYARFSHVPRIAIAVTVKKSTVTVISTLACACEQSYAFDSSGPLFCPSPLSSAITSRSTPPRNARAALSLAVV